MQCTYASCFPSPISFFAAAWLFLFGQTFLLLLLLLLLRSLLVVCGGPAAAARRESPRHLRYLRSLLALGHYKSRSYDIDSGGLAEEGFCRRRRRLCRRRRRRHPLAFYSLFHVACNRATSNVWALDDARAVMVRACESADSHAGQRWSLERHKVCQGWTTEGANRSEEEGSYVPYLPSVKCTAVSIVLMLH